MPASDNEQLAAVHSFLLRYAEDNDAQHVRDLAHYQAMHPGYETEIAAEYLRLSRHSGPDSGDDRSPLVLQQLGPYRITRELGVGGQAVVYEAEDERLGRTVALKVYAARGTDPKLRQRLEREARTAARIRDDHVCTVFEADERDGLLFLAMECVSGPTLARWIATERNRPTCTPVERIARAVGWFEVIARAVDAGHRAGVVHRDLKPSNIALREGCTPIVLDFGLARFEQDLGADLTASGDVAGTPSYLAPELLENNERAGVATDIYALGVALFETVTLTLPFAAATRSMLYEKIRSGRPPRASQCAPRVPPDLDLVIATALERDPSRRYRTAADLAEDLRRLQAHTPIAARPIPVLLRGRRWFQRNRAGAATMLALATALAGALVLLEERSNALQAARISGLVAASAASLATDSHLALMLALDAFALDCTSPATISQLLEAAASAHERRPLREPSSGHIGNLLLSPDGSRLLALGGRGINYLHDLRSGAATELLGGATGYRSGAFSPDGTRCVVLGTMPDGTGMGELWTLEPGPARIATLVRPKSFGELLRDYRAEQGVAFAPDGRTLATAERGPTACLWDGRTGELQGEPLVHGHGQSLTAVAFSPDGSCLLTASRGGVLTTWDLGTRPPTPTTQARHAAAIRALLPLGTNVLTADLAGTLGFGPPVGEPRVYRLSDSAVEGAAISAAGDRFLIAAGHAAHLLDRSGQRVASLPEHDSLVWSGAFSPHGDVCLTFGTDGRLRLFDLEGRACLTLRGHRDFVTAACFSNDGSEVYSSSWDGSVRRWQLQVAGFEALRDHDEAIGGLEFSPDGRWLASGDRGGGCVLLWDARDVRQAPQSLAVDLTKVTDLAFLGPDRLVVVGDAGRGDARGSRLIGLAVPSGNALWPARKTAAEESRLAIQLSPTPLIAVAVQTNLQVFDQSGASIGGRGGRCPCFAPDGRSVLTVNSSQVLALDLATGQQSEVFSSPDLTMLERIAAHRDTGRIAIGASDGQAALLAVIDGRYRELARWRPHPSRLSSLRFSPDGTQLLTTAKGDAARLWRVADQRLVYELRGHRGFVNLAVFSHDGTRIATGGSDGLVRLWPADPGVAARFAQLLVFRGLAPDERARYAELLGR